MNRPTARRVAAVTTVTVGAVAVLYAAGLLMLAAWLCIEVKDAEEGEQ